jgi:glucosamine--fructose-6-phosphate aminotransferase (isomerizing)
MFREAAEAPEAVARQLDANRERMRRVGLALRECPPRVVVTCARGSSDHAATFARYLIETRTGVLTASTPPSVSSVYGVRRDLRGVLFLAISQSGASPDLVAAARSAKEAGARVLALVNAAGSPLAETADHIIALDAGLETSVAATKSYIATLAALVHLVSRWTGDEALLAALEDVPAALASAWELDWSPALAAFERASSLYVLGRGLGLGAVEEAALKLKETCAVHAEGLSAAEARHGPMALVREGFPVLIFTQNDATRAGVLSIAAEFAAHGARVLIAGGSEAHRSGFRSDFGSNATSGPVALPLIEAHPAIEPMLFIQRFYRLANALALARGLDPDHPPHLAKVTETV